MCGQATTNAITASAATGSKNFITPTNLE